MCHGRPLLAGLGWAATLGGLALCVLILLSAFLAFDDDHDAARPRNDGVVRLLSLPDAEIPLARPPRRGTRAIPPVATTPPPGPEGVDALIPRR